MSARASTTKASAITVDGETYTLLPLDRADPMTWSVFGPDGRISAQSLLQKALEGDKKAAKLCVRLSTVCRRWTHPFNVLCAHKGDEGVAAILKTPVYRVQRLRRFGYAPTLAETYLLRDALSVSELMEHSYTEEMLQKLAQ